MPDRYAYRFVDGDESCFDQLFDRWSTLEKFQRTRGVLRLMAAVIHELWEREDAGLLIEAVREPPDPRRPLPNFLLVLALKP